MGNELQENIMLFISKWARENKGPIPRKNIVTAMTNNGVKSFTTINAINVLLRKGYVRRSVGRSNTTSYVQIRTLFSKRNQIGIKSELNRNE